jgi:hypothetical protein
MSALSDFDLTLDIFIFTLSALSAFLLLDSFF